DRSPRPRRRHRWSAGCGRGSRGWTGESDARLGNSQSQRRAFAFAGDLRLDSAQFLRPLPQATQAFVDADARFPGEILFFAPRVAHVNGLIAGPPSREVHLDWLGGE